MRQSFTLNQQDIFEAIAMLLRKNNIAVASDELETLEHTLDRHGDDYFVTSLTVSRRFEPPNT